MWLTERDDGSIVPPGHPSGLTVVQPRVLASLPQAIEDARATPNTPAIITDSAAVMVATSPPRLVAAPPCDYCEATPSAPMLLIDTDGTEGTVGGYPDICYCEQCADHFATLVSTYLDVNQTELLAEAL